MSALFADMEMLHLSPRHPGRDRVRQFMPEHVRADGPEENPLKSKITDNTGKKIKRPLRHIFKRTQNIPDAHGHPIASGQEQYSETKTLEFLHDSTLLIITGESCRLASPGGQTPPP